MVQATASILGKTETAPNRSTGSGQLVFPRADGVVSSFPPGGYWKRRVPETSPCHGQAKQSGELDPRKVTRGCQERSRGIETSTELVIGSRSASAQFVIGSARGQPRLDPVKENLRSPARRPIQACEVEPSPQGSRAGSRSQMLTPAPCVRSFASVRQTARRAGPRLVQLVLYMIFSIGYISYRICSHRTLA